MHEGCGGKVNVTRYGAMCDKCGKTVIIKHPPILYIARSEVCKGDINSEAI